MIYWFTGQPGSGKSTLATLLSGRRFPVQNIVDGDSLRQLFPESYDKHGRRRNVERAQVIARYLNDAGYDVCVALVSPYRQQRELFRSICGRDLCEIYLHTTADRGKGAFQVADYEPPLRPDLNFDTGQLTIAQCVNAILDWTDERHC